MPIHLVLFIPKMVSMDSGGSGTAVKVLSGVAVNCSGVLVEVGFGVRVTGIGVWVIVAVIVGVFALRISSLCPTNIWGFAADNWFKLTICSMVVP